ncbi:MAG: hypothetical protein DHS20C18_27050 [Saprospiraceae bacterium]|nr:MAG: hypothetical protein DHS20C18_27050 [Saprospiraceae bacterium]
MAAKFYLCDMTIIYLHGFNSDGGGYKYDQLCDFFQTGTILSPDLDAEPMKVVGQIDQLLTTLSLPVYLVGTSLGGFYAMYFSARLNVPCFLYNPSLQPHLTLHRGIGRHQTFMKGRDYHFKATYLPVFGQLKREADAVLRPENLNFFLATDDDVLDLKPIPGRFPNANHLSWHKNAAHGFSKFKETLPVVKTLLSAYQSVQKTQVRM